MFRFKNLQYVLPFLPDPGQLIRSEDEAANFLLGVGLFIEGDLNTDQSQILVRHIIHRCLILLESPPNDVSTICALMLVALYCPDIIPSRSPIGMIAGSQLFASVKHSSILMSSPSIIEHFRQYASSPDAQSLPVQCDIIQNATICFFMAMHLALFDLHGESAKDYGSSPSLRQSSSSSSSSSSSPSHTEHEITTANDLNMLSRYAKAALNVETQTLMTKKIETQEEKELHITSIRRLTGILLLSLRAQATKSYHRVSQKSLRQYEESVSKMTEPSEHIFALRTWCERVIDAVISVSTECNRELTSIVEYLGASDCPNNANSNRLRDF